MYEALKIAWKRVVVNVPKGERCPSDPRSRKYWWTDEGVL